MLLKLLQFLNCLFLSVILLYSWSRSRTNRRGICLMGLCESGKTLIFNQLVFGKAVETYTSMKENTSSIEVKNKVSVTVVLESDETLIQKNFIKQ